MPIPKKILNHLNKNKVKYEEVAHKTVYTAFDLANNLKEKLENIAKTLVIKADKNYYLVVLPAHRKLDLDKLKKKLKVEKIEIVKEKVMSKMFKVKPGAITPFGTVHKVEVLADKALAKTTEAIFQAGNFTKSLRIKVKDFLELEEAKLIDFGKAAGYKVPKVKKKMVIKKTSAKKRKK